MLYIVSLIFINLLFCFLNFLHFPPFPNALTCIESLFILSISAFNILSFYFGTSLHFSSFSPVYFFLHSLLIACCLFALSLSLCISMFLFFPYSLCSFCKILPFLRFRYPVFFLYESLSFSHSLPSRISLFARFCLCVSFHLYYPFPCAALSIASYIPPWEDIF